MEEIILEEPYVSILIKSREKLKDSPLLNILDNIIKIELELALMGSEKAMKKLTKGSTVRSIK